MDLEDADEKAEIVSNIKDLLAPFPGTASLSICTATEGSYVEVGFTLHADASRAAGALDGFMLAGQALQVLMVQVEEQVQEQISTEENMSSTTVSKLPAVLPSEDMSLLCLQGVLQGDEEDDDLLETLGDLLALAAGYGARDAISSISAHRAVPQANSVHIAAAVAALDQHQLLLPIPLPWMTIELSAASAAVAVMTALNGLVIAGEALSTAFCHVPAYHAGMPLEQAAVPGAEGEGAHWLAVHLTSSEEAQDVQDRVLLALQGVCMVERTSVQEVAEGVELCLQMDLTSCCEAFDALLSQGMSMSVVRRTAPDACAVLAGTAGHCRAVVLVSGYLCSADWADLLTAGHEDMAALMTDLLSLIPSHAVRGIGIYPPTDPVPAGGLCVSMAFTNRAACLQAMVQLDGLRLGGVAIRAHIADAVDGEVLASISGGSGDKGGVPVMTVGACEGAVCVYEEVWITAPTTADTAVAPADDASGSKYDQAKAIARISAHTAPAHSHIPVASDEVNLLVKSLLSLLSTFQARLKEKNPLNYKRKIRFVTGIRQATQAVKLGKVKLLVLAPNTEAADELDSKIDVLVAEAQARDVGMLYALNKRQLGKALQMSMKQSVVAVMDPDGAYELYRQIVRFIRPPP